MSKTKVVITGMGAVTPLGNDLSTTWTELIHGKSSQRPVTLFDVSQCRCQNACESQLPSPPINRKTISRLSRASRLAIPAAQEALSQAGLSSLSYLPISLSTTGGGMTFGETFLKKILTHQKGSLLGLVARYQPQQQLLDLQEQLNISGPSMIIANACASGANAIGHAYDMIRAGQTDYVLTGGVEALTELIFVGFDCLQATSTEVCRPFDKNRSGLILGEAAAFLVLESEAYAKKRGAKILAEIIGYGHSTDVHHLTQPAPQGHALFQAMQSACKSAKIDPQEIHYINAHGTGTSLNDSAETASFTHFFGETFAQIKMSSTKAQMGHTLGAAGAIEAIFAAKTLMHQKLPTQINLKNPIPEIASSLVTASDPFQPIHITMSVNLGFGGSNAALVFRRYVN
ncbi:MAG: beta-ketoacyl-[acyl-carrier-protein] synthase family protein [Verrucomicrobiae bacterium]|nr:beta-ketoacyl-[acyl-carrier-protein] synthase family protein [Verrucomicrobiae bacterium]